MLNASYYKFFYYLYLTPLLDFKSIINTFCIVFFIYFLFYTIRIFENNYLKDEVSNFFYVLELAHPANYYCYSILNLNCCCLPSLSCTYINPYYSYIFHTVI